MTEILKKELSAIIGYIDSICKGNQEIPKTLKCNIAEKISHIRYLIEVLHDKIDFYGVD